MVAVVRLHLNELWKLCMTSIPDLPINVPRLMVVGLDREVATFARRHTMSLPHDIINIMDLNMG